MSLQEQIANARRELARRVEKTAQLRAAYDRALEDERKQANEVTRLLDEVTS